MKNRTFADFINTYNVEIPIIQRDYVYGRESSRTIGIELVKAMINAIREKKVLDLNFIYGIETGSEDKYYFPIDGQQRLTTLFLLYWYLSIKSGKEGEFFQLHPDFSYKTRSSAKDFFMWISDKENKELFDLIKKSDAKLDESIWNMSGFKAAWNYDNTVQSCIFMLNQIAEMLKNDNNIESYYENLNNPNECYIKFTIINENSDVNEMLFADKQDGMNEAKAMANKTYIRMNARGKQLTDFEKIKSLVDSLEVEGKENTRKFSYKYDTKYIDKMYEYVKSNSGLLCISLKDITDKIDRMSHIFFINMFNIFCKSEEKEVCFSSETYIRELKGLADDKRKAEIYIDFMDYYMQYLLDIEKYDSKAFHDLGMRYDLDIIYAEVLYIYYYAKKHDDRILSKEDIEIFQLVLRNLKYNMWNFKYKNLKEFIKDIACKDSLIQYFSDTVQCNEAVIQCGIPDINTRWKEQVLLAKCCVNDEVKEKYSDFSDYSYFEKYRTKCDKLQFVMYVADIWDELSPDFLGFERFFQYLDEYSKYQNDELYWRQNYAISAYTRNNQLMSDDDINSIQMGKAHIWDDARYKWDDEEEKSKSYRQYLGIAKKTYEIGNENLLQLREQLIRNDNIWLGYALKWSEDLKECKRPLVCTELFKCTVTNENTSLGSVIFERNETDKKPFMMHIFKISRLKTGQEEFSYGFKECSETILSKVYSVHLENMQYREYVSNPEYYNFRACNIEVLVKEKIFNERFSGFPSNEQLCLYGYEENHRYCIYEYHENNPNSFKKYEYDISDYITDCNKNKGIWKCFDLTVFDRLRAYIECGGWNSSAIHMPEESAEQTCDLWKLHKFLRSRSKYEHTIIYKDDIDKVDDGNTFIVI